MKFIDPKLDPWHSVIGDDGPVVTITPKDHSLLTLLQWHGVRAQWSPEIKVGVVLPNDSDIEELEADLPRLSLIALEFPKWVDGRAYSQARLLRSRYRFAGEVRATGQVLVDMLPLLARTGFDSVQLRGDQSREAALRALSFFPAFYQADVYEQRPVFARPESGGARVQSTGLFHMSAIALYAKETPGFEQRLQEALTLLQQAAAEHEGRIVQATSLGAEDMVITDLIARHQLPIPIGTLETGKLHPQTIALIERTESQYELAVEIYRPQAHTVIEFVERHGEQAMFKSIELRKACCSIRKLEPLSRMLEGRTAWITGLRREQSGQRGEVSSTESDGHGRIKFNPLAAWSWADVWHYISTHQVPYNPLHDEFMPSIGCAPCTRAIAVGEDFRAGRWWWEDEAAKECGLHVHDPVPAAVSEIGEQQ